MYKRLLFTLSIVALLAIGCNKQPSPIVPSQKIPVEGSFVTIRGDRICLPHKSKAVEQSLECAIGLKGEDGRNYGLQNFPRTARNAELVEVTGIFTKDTQSIYDIVGSISVTTFKDEIDFWQDYDNVTYSFQLKYPQNFLLEEERTYPYIVTLRPKEFKDDRQDLALQIDPVGPGSETVFDKDAKPSCAITTITFSSRLAQKCSGSNNGASYRYIRITDFKSINWKSDNMISYSVPFANKDIAQTYEKIISTITFTSTAETANWKTYQNNLYEYSIKYPTDWFIDTTSSEGKYSLRGPKGDNEYIGGDTVFSNKKDYSGTPKDPMPAGLYVLYFNVYPVDVATTYGQFITKHGFAVGQGVQLVSKKNIVISSMPALEYTTITTDHPTGVTGVLTFVKVDQKMFVFSYSGNAILLKEKNNIGNIIQSFTITK